MICERCNDNIEEGDERELHGKTLCEDCYIDALSPSKGCDPWAVYCAKSSLKNERAEPEITELQSKILQILKETGGIEPEEIIKRLSIKPSELEREIATLRHMEKVKGQIRGEKRVLCLWD